MVAPESERSAIGHAVTMAVPLRAWADRLADGRDVVAVDGTPADCVKIAVKALCPRRPDLVMSGINQGGNAGVNVIYSGTVSAAIEATILGIPAAAVSLDTFTRPDFGDAAAFAGRLGAKLLAEGLPRGVLLNVNVPPGAVRGVRFTRQSGAVLDDYYEERTDPRGRRYFWLAAERMLAPDPRDDDDLTALAAGFVSITPLRYDLTDEAALTGLARWTTEL